MNTTKSFFALLAGLTLALSVLPGCGDTAASDDGPAVVRDFTTPPPDMTVIDMAVAPGDMAVNVIIDMGFDPVKMCYPVPDNTHEQIINACTTAQCIKKTPKAIYLDGGCCPLLP